VQELDKAAMGRRIRQIRLGEGLRQWELAKRLGTTQSAVHKYEHGVVPEPRRLMELARIGGTSVEWVLTGSHWENGSQDQKRLSAEVLSTASRLREISQSGREALDEALRIIREAVRTVVGPNGDPPSPTPAAIAASLQDHAPQTLELLESAWRIQRAVLRRVSEDAEKRLSRISAAESADGTDEPPD